ncbi:MAG: hypothetical protein HZB15_10455, partial [Actinobacteria bacterium]|nr:hypothetical protein [Actinomycetota bacterium]
MDDLCRWLESIDGVDDVDARRRKGSPELLAALEAASTAHVVLPTERVRQPVGARMMVFEPDEMAEWIVAALDGNLPVNRRRESLRAIVGRALLQRTGSDSMYTRATELRSVLQKAWPAMQPVKLVDRLLLDHGFGPGGKRRRW